MIISTDKTSYKIKCGQPFRIVVEIGGVDSDSNVTVCFLQESTSCKFIQEGEQNNSICKPSFNISHSDRFVKKIYYLKLVCEPTDSYSIIMDVKATTGQGEQESTSVGLDILP